MTIHRVHICNAALPENHGWLEIGYSYEDTDLASICWAEQTADFIDATVPGAFTLVTTGDYIKPKCWLEHRECIGTYDPEYHFYLVPTALWAKQQDAILERDIAWREACLACQRTEKEA
jgi:hypothetical protein